MLKQSNAVIELSIDKTPPKKIISKNPSNPIQVPLIIEDISEEILEDKQGQQQATPDMFYKKNEKTQDLQVLSGDEEEEEGLVVDNLGKSSEQLFSDDDQKKVTKQEKGVTKQGEHSQIQKQPQANVIQEEINY